MGEILDDTEIATYHCNGYMVLHDYLDGSIIDGILDDITRITQEAAHMDESNDRIDVADDHTRESPKIRRIKLPHQISNPVRELLMSQAILGVARDLIGPDLRLHTTKLNMKLAGHGDAIAWHQDFAFYPHTNDDALAIGVMLDDVTTDNGPLIVFPKTHQGPIHDHHIDNVFAGAMDLPRAGLSPKNA
ncbi:MAG: phytanoyl-CoA dioxygenase family protein, partial [Pseudomonadota bacterium]